MEKPSLRKDKPNGKFLLGERTPSEKYIFRMKQWKSPAWGRIINGKFLFVEGFFNGIFH
jgi:hypothetical protein